LRGVIQQLEGLSEEEICRTDLPSGIPILYSLGPELQPVGPRQFLADQDVVAEGVRRVGRITEPAD